MSSIPSQRSLDDSTPDLVEDPIPDVRGASRRLPDSRKLVCDLLHFSKPRPTQPLARDCVLADLVELRNSTRDPRISWAAIFIKAYASVVSKHSELRQIYLKYPWPHVYEFPVPIARMTVSRVHRDQEWVFFAPIVQPNALTLAEVQERIDKFKSHPVSGIPRFRQQEKIARLPTFLRRIAWWVTMNFGAIRAKRLGTFGMTTVSATGAHSIHPPSLYTTMLTYGPISDAGEVRITLVYDHRLLDGGQVGRFLRELEETLNGPIADELRDLAS